MFAKTGAAVGLDALNDRLGVGAITIAGYPDKDDGRFDVSCAGLTGASTPTTGPSGNLGIAHDLAMIAAYLQEATAAPVK
ncbi:hypothetical protein ACIQV3_08765 [Streptomyces sp. NPDC099050]|uniref:hypothetical protein n=1 Tax=Streptomyces sp. NPDC099050 TaxID=3366100 RepID=UPI003827B8B2